MKIVPITQQTAFVRHWFRWYRVQRAGEDWRRLEIGRPYQKPKRFNLDKVAKELEKKYPRKPLPSILDEKKADREVKKHLPKK